MNPYRCVHLRERVVAGVDLGNTYTAVPHCQVHEGDTFFFYPRAQNKPPEAFICPLVIGSWVAADTPQHPT